MRAFELITESRGVTARTPGETYISNTDENDVLTIQDILVLPKEGDAFRDKDEMLSAVEGAVPDKNAQVNDNNPNSGSLAAVIATVTDKDNNPQYWVRYLKSIPAAGIHGTWKTLNGYKFSAGVEKESLPIKPSDIITDENYRSRDELANSVVQGTEQLVQGTGNEDLAVVMKSAVEQAKTGRTEDIDGAGKYFNVLQKYAGEYLGPIALTSTVGGASVRGDTGKLFAAFEVNNFLGAKIMFPQHVSQELIDSYIQLADGRRVQISSKISTSGGAASSLSGVYKQMTPEIEAQYPRGSLIIKTLATESAINGPLKVARSLQLINQQDIVALNDLDKRSQSIQDLGTERLQRMTNEQGVQSGTLQRPDYRVFWHAMTAIVNQMVPIVNSMDEFKSAMLATLNNNQYVQLVTQGKQTNDAVKLSYFTKFPAVFAGDSQLVNKTYFATGQKGRIGFKLK